MWTAVPWPCWYATPKLSYVFSVLLVTSGIQRLLVLGAVAYLASVAPLPDKVHQPLPCKLQASSSSLLLWGFPSLGNLAMHTLGCPSVHDSGTRSAYQVTYQLLSASEYIFRITSKQTCSIECWTARKKHLLFLPKLTPFNMVLTLIGKHFIHMWKIFPFSVIKLRHLLPRWMKNIQESK